MNAAWVAMGCMVVIGFRALSTWFQLEPSALARTASLAVDTPEPIARPTLALALHSSRTQCAHSS